MNYQESPIFVTAESMRSEARMEAIANTLDAFSRNQMSANQDTNNELKRIVGNDVRYYDQQLGNEAILIQSVQLLTNVLVSLEKMNYDYYMMSLNAMRLIHFIIAEGIARIIEQLYLTNLFMASLKEILHIIKNDMFMIGGGGGGVLDSTEKVTSIAGTFASGGALIGANFGIVGAIPGALAGALVGLLVASFANDKDNEISDELNRKIMESNKEASEISINERMKMFSIKMEGVASLNKAQREYNDSVENSNSKVNKLKVALSEACENQKYMNAVTMQMNSNYRGIGESTKKMLDSLRAQYGILRGDELKGTLSKQGNLQKLWGNEQDKTELMANPEQFGKFAADVERLAASLKGKSTPQLKAFAEEVKKTHEEMKKAQAESIQLRSVEELRNDTVKALLDQSKKNIEASVMEEERMEAKKKAIEVLKEQYNGMTDKSSAYARAIQAEIDVLEERNKYSIKFRREEELRDEAIKKVLQDTKNSVEAAVQETKVQEAKKIAMAELVKQYDQLTDKTGAYGKALQDKITQLKYESGAMTDVERKYYELNKAMDLKPVVSMSGSVEALNKYFLEHKAEILANKENYEKFKQKVQELCNALGGIPKELKDTAKQVDVANPKLTKFIESIQKKMELLKTGKEYAEAGVDMLSNMGILSEDAAAKVKEKVGAAFQAVSGGMQAGMGVAKLFKGDLTGILDVFKGIGSVFSALKKLFGGDGVGEAIKRENSWMNLTKQQTEELRKLEKQYKSVHAATSVMLDGIIKEANVNAQNFDQYAGRVREIISDLHQGKLTTQQTAKEMGEAWTALLDKMKELNFNGITGTMAQTIIDVRNQGLKVPEIQKFVMDELGKSVKGMETYLKGSGDAYRELAEKQREYEKALQSGGKDTKALADAENALAAARDKLSKTAVSSQKDFNRAALQTVGVFSALLSEGKSFNEALTEMGGSFDALMEIMKGGGFEASAGLQKIFDVRQFVNDNKILVDQIDAQRQAMMGLYNSVYMTQDIFLSYTQSAKENHEKMMLAGATERESLQLLAPTLSDILWMSKQRGMTIDEETMALIRKAEQEGINLDHQLTEKELLQSISDTMKELVGIFKGDLPQAVADGTNAAVAGAERLRDSLERIPRHWDFSYSYSENPNGGGAIEAAAGWHGLVKAGTYQRFLVGEGGEDEIVDITPVSRLRDSRPFLPSNSLNPVPRDYVQVGGDSAPADRAKDRAIEMKLHHESNYNVTINGGSDIDKRKLKDVLTEIHTDNVRGYVDGIMPEIKRRLGVRS